MKRLKQLVTVVRKSAVVVHLALVLARVVVALPGGPARARRVHVLLAPPGGGNIGDQAMVESFVENVAGPIRVVVTDLSAVDWDGLPGDRVRPVVLPELLYGIRLLPHLRDVRRLRGLLREAASFSVVGADIMDGAYNRRASLRRAAVAGLAARSGVDTRVLGFSWNDAPVPAVRRELRSASARGVALLLRDPVSADRARADGLHGVVGAADTVFSLRSTDHGAVGALLPDVPGDRPLALVNVSALVGGSFDQTGEYVTVVHHLRDAGFAVVLVPHVCRPGGDDREACRRVEARLEPGAATLVDRVLTPGQVKALCARSDVVVTGRMHLAIMALTAGVPAITLATQGKVEGLMQLFGVPELCVVPRAGMADDVIGLVRRATAADGAMVRRIRTALPDAVELSARNFAGLPTTRPDRSAAHGDAGTARAATTGTVAPI